MKNLKYLLDKGCKVKFRALMSANWDEFDVHDAKNLGCKIFCKPFNIEELLSWLDNCRQKIDAKRVLSNWVLLGKK